MPWRSLVFAAGLVALTMGAFHSGSRAGANRVTSDWQRAQLAYDAAVRLREDQYLTARAAAEAQRIEGLKSAESDAAKLRATSERLRVALRDAIGRIPAENGGTTSGAGSAGTVLADVCGRAGEAASRMAAYADRERIARQECQRAWPR